MLSRLRSGKNKQEYINEEFISLYSLEKEMSAHINRQDITLFPIDITYNIKSLMSYAVGCMFGRYSLDKEGLIYAGGEWNINRYTTFNADEDNYIPITDEEYFSDDIVGRFVEFVKTVYGPDTLEENLDFITKALGNKGDTSREVICNYFLKEFYADHLKAMFKEAKGNVTFNSDDMRKLCEYDTFENVDRVAKRSFQGIAIDNSSNIIITSGNNRLHEQEPNKDKYITIFYKKAKKAKKCSGI